MLSRKFKLFALSLISIIGSDAHALPITIADNFVGGSPNSPYYGLDVIGDVNSFDIDHIVVDLVGNNLSVAIYSTFFDNVGRLGTTLGDLFISVDGWHPFGAAPYKDDNAFSGEDWEYVLALDDHGVSSSTSSMIGKNGAANLYAVNDISEISLSNNPNPHRKFQEWIYLANGKNPVSTGTWQITDTPGQHSILTFYLALPPGLQTVTDFGFHWAMSCGNDVIEGSAKVPEPITAALVGGALGICAFARRRRKGQQTLPV